MQIPFGPEGKVVSRVKYGLSDPGNFRTVNAWWSRVPGDSAVEAAVDLAGFHRHGDEFVFARRTK